MNDEIVQSEQINWEYLCLEAEKLDATTAIFKTRRGAIRILTEIKGKLSWLSKKDVSRPLSMSLMTSRMRWCVEYWDGYKQDILDPNYWGTPTEMIKSLIDAGLLEGTFWKLEDSQLHA